MPVKSVIKYIKANSFIKNFATLFTGNIIAQLIVFLAAPVITSLYTPEEFGVMAFIQSAAVIFSVAACFRYRFAIVLPKEKDKSLNLVIISFLSVIVTVFLMVVFIYLFKSEITALSGFKGNIVYLYFIPAIVLFEVIKEIMAFVFVRYKRFKFITVSIIIMSLASNSIKIFTGFFFTASSFWLIFGNMTAPVIGLIIYIIFIGKKNFNWLKKITYEDLKETAKEYYKFPIYNAPTNLINSFSQYLSVFLLSAFFNEKILGLYALASMVVMRPLNIIGVSISKVFFQKSAEINNKNGNLYNSLKKITFWLGLISFFPFCLFVLLSPYIFGGIFGKRWIDAGLYAQVLIPWLFVMLLKTPANQIVFTKQMFRFDMIFNVAVIIIQAGSFYLCFKFFDSPLFSIAGFSIAGFLMYSFFIYFVFRCLKQEYTDT